ncbi:MAG: glutamine--fructose-6-phosphate aminotransferase, partial [Clostridia bacterium]|nr:glutamine--fructose-6-phosphate aminotransferase [Clostridia bacterium]
MTLMKKEIFEQPEALKKCLEFNKPVLEKLVAVLKNSDVKNVYVAARGTSDHAGIYGKYLIESMLGIPCGLAAPSTITLYGGRLKLKDMLVIGISQSGKAADVLEVINNAKACGAVTLTITNTLESPLASAADYHLYCNAGLEQSVAATKTFGTQLYLMANLVSMWADNTELLKELANIPENLNKVLDMDSTIADIAKRYRFMSECFVLSRGINYPLAMEAT